MYAVKNTCGEQYAYVLPVATSTAGWIRQTCLKAFYVSPFIEADITYRFRLNQPSERLAVLIRAEVEAGPLLITALSGERRRLTARQPARQALRHPLLAQ